MLVQRITISDDLLKKSAYIFIAALLSYIALFGFELTHFTLSIDEEARDNFKQALILGRWGHALLRLYILPEPFVPFFTMMLAIIIIAVSSMIACLYLELSLSNSVAFVIMLAAIPQVTYQLEFNNQADTIAISMLCSVSSLYLLRKINIAKSLTFISLTVISLSIYQSIFLYAASLLCVWIAINAIRGKVYFLDVVKLGLIFIALVIVSLVINSYMSALVAEHYNFAISSYLLDRMGWDIASPSQVIINMMNMVRDYLTFKAEYGLNSFPFSLIFLAASLASLWANRKNALLVILSSFAVLVSAFVLNFAIGMRLPPRTMTQIPMVFAGLFIISVVAWRMNVSALILSLIFLCVGAASSNSLFYSDYMARKADDNLSQRIIETIYQNHPSINLEETALFFYGSYAPYNQWSVPNSDVFGRSFYSQDHGNNLRMYRYLATSNIMKVKTPTPEQVNKARIDGDALPSWPDRKSVAIVDGVLIVKLSGQLGKYNR